MSKPTETEILSAIKTLQAALVNKWGDEALSAGDGEGCSIDIRFGGVALVEPKCDCEFIDATAEVVAAELAKPSGARVLP